MNTLLGLFGIAAGLLFATSVGVKSMSPPEYDVARGTAIGASVSAIITYFLWILTTDEQLPTKVFVGLATGIVVLGILPVGLDWISRIQARNLQLLQSAPPASLNTGVLSPESHILFTPDGQGTIPGVQIGESQVFFVSGQSNPYSAILLPALREQQFKVESVDGKIKISAHIANESGNMIIEIDRRMKGCTLSGDMG